MAKRFWLTQINTTEYDRLVRFYVDVLGFVEDPGIQPRPELPPPTRTVMDALGLELPTRMGMFRLPGDMFRLEVLEWPKARFIERPRDINAGGMVRVGLYSENMDEDLAKLRAHGVEIIFDDWLTNLNWGPLRYAFCRDPDGNLIEYFQGDVMD